MVIIGMLGLKPSSGRTLPEYALLAGLVALAAIPSLGLLSGSLQSLLTRDLSSQASQLFSLLDSKSTPSAVSSSMNDLQTQQAQNGLSQALSDLQKNGGSASMKLDSSGKLQININGIPLGTSEDSTGAQGGGVLMSYVMADQIQALAEEVVATDPSLASRLTYLASLGRGLAQMEGNVNKAIESNDKAVLTIGQVTNTDIYPFPVLPVNPLTGAPPNAGQITLSSKQLPLVYFQMHQAMIDASNSLLGSIPADSTIHQRLGLYTSAIDSVGNLNYTTAPNIFYNAQNVNVPLATTNPNYSPSSAFSSYYKDSVFPNITPARSVGSYTVDTSGITIDIAPKFTQVTSDKIAAAQQAAAAGVSPTATTSAVPATSTPAAPTTSLQDGALPN
ncbi:MAG: hypothetical protein IPK79_08705 [Vampirovibrionales bacterium]|nr:hypothetical protein [Vampirovibrionales bacterium]